MKSFKLKATTMRSLLAVIILVSLCLLSFAFYQTHEHFKDIAYAVKSSGSTNSGKANLVTSGPATFLQQIKQSLSTYASASGITVKSIKALPTQKSDSDLQSLTDLQFKSVQVTIQNPVPYVSFLKFIKAIESNLPIIKITNIKLGRDKTSPSNINVDQLIISSAVR